MKLSVFLSIVVASCILQPAKAQSKKKLYYTNRWVLTTEDSAHYYRLCAVDALKTQFTGEVADYLLNDQLVMKGYYGNGIKNGDFISYYPNGQIEFQGQFQNDKRFGVLKYYFQNGKIWREVAFSGDDFIVNSLYDASGKKLIDNGTGEWQYEYEWPGFEFTFIVQGHFENGKKQGEWRCSASNGDILYTETFNKNKFKKGILFEGGVKKEYAKEFENKFLLPYKFQVTEQFMHSKSLTRTHYSFLNFLPFPIRKFPTEIDTTGVVFALVEQQAEFAGGIQSMSQFLGRTMKYPSEARRRGIQGTVFLSFIVNTDGSISDITLVKGIGKECDQEAIRVISLSPKWIPGTQNGKAVRSRFVLPLKFKLAR